MRKALVVGIPVFIVIVASLTGLAYCWQQGLDDAGPLVGFVVSLAVLLVTVVAGTTYGVAHAVRWIDDYIRDVSSASMQVARETAEETVENIPETLMDGIEKSIKKTRDRFFGGREYTPPWKKKEIPPKESEGDSVRSEDASSEGSRPRPGAVDKTELYRRLIDDAVEQFRDKRKRRD